MYCVCVLYQKVEIKEYFFLLFQVFLFYNNLVCLRIFVVFGLMSYAITKKGKLLKNAKIFLFVIELVKTVKS
ncbi:hypothetical protein DR095_03025 [Mycoplasma flocculare]|nr:hypothetical protein [Mesomycoplasma flocculare]